MKDFLMDALIYSYLIAKLKQCVNVNGHWSNWETLKSSIPQGTVLAPTLFFIFVNDLSEGLDNGCSIFADDTTANTIGSDLQTGTKALSSYFDNAYEWASTCGVLFTVKKSNHLTIGTAAALPEGTDAIQCDHEWLSHTALNRAQTSRCDH